MKKIFFGILAMAAFAACSNEEQIAAPQGEAIAFGNAFVDNSVRAGEATDPSYGTHNSLISFNVWGTVKGTTNPVAIFAGDAVEGTVGTHEEEGEDVPNVWTCTKTQYWINGAKYNFAAVVNGEVTDLFEYNAEEPESYKKAHLPKTIKFNTPEAADVDLLYAPSLEYTGKTSGNNELVKFDFAHLLSKVKFSVVNNSQAATGYSFLVKDIKITAVDTANYDVETSTWATGDTAKFALAEVSLTNNTATTVESAAEKLIIPGTVSVEFVVDILCNGTVITSTPYTHNNIALEAGKAYSLKAQVAVGDPIQFTVEKNPTWTVVTPDSTLN